MHFTECAIVRMAEQKCNMNFYYTGMQCDFQTNTCSLIYSDESKFQFWFQEYFNVTKTNIKQVEGNVHLDRYLCIQKDKTIGISEGAVCIRKMMLRGFIHSFQNISFVMEYLATNLETFTFLNRNIARQIKEIPSTVALFTKDGKRVESSLDDVFVLPSDLRVTSELISWMRASSYLSFGICNALGLRKLDTQEIKAFDEEKEHLGCFYDESGSPIEFMASDVWSFGLNVATSQNYAKITDKNALNFAIQKRSVLFLNNQIEVPNDWINLAKNIYIKKISARHLYVSPEEFENILKSNETKALLKEKGEFLIVSGTIKDQSILKEFNYVQIDSNFLFFDQKMKFVKNRLVMEDIPLNLLWSPIGFEFFVKFNHFEKDSYFYLPSWISQFECLQLKSMHFNEFYIQCGEYSIQKM